jgi:hypothetical protein
MANQAQTAHGQGQSIPIGEQYLRIELAEDVASMGKKGDQFDLTQNEYAQAEKAGQLTRQNHRILGTPGSPRNDRVEGLSDEQRAKRDSEQGTEGPSEQPTANGQ